MPLLLAVDVGLPPLVFLMKFEEVFRPPPPPYPPDDAIDATTTQCVHVQSKRGIFGRGADGESSTGFRESCKEPGRDARQRPVCNDSEHAKEEAERAREETRDIVAMLTPHAEILARCHQLRKI